MASGDNFVLHTSCPKCGSSDAVGVYDDGHGHCYSCDTAFPPGAFAMTGEAQDVEPGRKKSKAEKALIPSNDMEIKRLTVRKLSEETVRKYGYGIAKYNGKDVQVANYHDPKSGRIVAQKLRFPDKDFTVLGDLKKAGLFGQNIARSGGKMIVVTEGEIDAMSVSQAMGLKWPAVSVPNGAAGAKKALAAQVEWLEGFETIVLAFDNDEAGRAATEECAVLFSPGKVKIATLPRKDANEMLQAGESRQLVDAIWGARDWRPDGVVNLKDTWDKVSKPVVMGTPYPWKGLNSLLFGMQEATVVVLAAGSGIGKSAFAAEIAYDLAVERKETVGYIALEEGIERTARRFMGIYLNLPIHLPGYEVGEKELRKSFDATIGTGRLVSYDHFGSLDSDILLSRMRYMVKGLGAKFIVLDHISMVVSGADLDTDERRLLDKIMTDLRSFAQETRATIIVVSHLRRPDGNRGHEDGASVSLAQLRGSHAIAQLADTVIGLERNQQADDEEERNTTTLRVLKNRYAGLTGEATSVVYDRKTGRLTELALSSLETVSGEATTDY